MSMLSTNSLFELFRITTYIQAEPCIDIQPTIFLPKCYHDFNNHDLLVPVKTLMGTEGVNRMFSLEFSVNYHVYSSSNVCHVLNYFKTNETRVVLKKFKKKRSKDEKYNVTEHEPTNVLLPGWFENINGICMVICIWTPSRDIYNLKKGCQLISLHMEGKEKITKRMLIQALLELRSFLGLKEEDTKGFAFQFSIEVERNNYHGDTDTNVKVYTFLFEIIFEENGYEMRLNEVDGTLYHMGD